MYCYSTVVGYMLLAPNFGIQGKNSKYINVKVNNNSYRQRICTSKSAKIHRFIRFVMYCIIITCSVECYWHYSHDAVYYKSDETVIFSPITVFINFVFYALSSSSSVNKCPVMSVSNDTDLTTKPCQLFPVSKSSSSSAAAARG